MTGKGIPEGNQVRRIVLQVGIQRCKPVSRAARNPATMAADCPTVALNLSERSSGYVSASSVKTSEVESVDPSSTTMISNLKSRLGVGLPDIVQRGRKARMISDTRRGKLDASFLAGMMTDKEVWGPNSRTIGSFRGNAAASWWLCCQTRGFWKCEWLAG